MYTKYKPKHPSIIIPKKNEKNKTILITRIANSNPMHPILFWFGKKNILLFNDISSCYLNSIKEYCLI